MKRRKLSSTVSLALLSLSIIVFNILQLCDGYDQYNQSITAVTIMLSVLVLVLSLLVSYLNYSEREMKYYDCGLKLSALCDEIDLVLSDPQKILMTNEHLRNLKDKYQRIIGECGINHIAIDHKRAKLRIPQNNEGSASQHKLPENYTRAQFWNFIFSTETWRPFMAWRNDKWNRTRVWIEWNILDVNFLYWALAIGIPILAWYIIFKSDVFIKALNAINNVIPINSGITF